MTFFSRCDPSQFSEAGRGTRIGTRSRFLMRVAGFGEDLAILFRYAMGLDYYGRGLLQPRDR